MSRRRRRPAQATPSENPDVREIIREELNKALVLPPGTKTTSYSANYLQALQARGGRSQGGSSLPRDPNLEAPFGPGQPLNYAPVSPPLPSGRPAPRQWEYPQSWNLQTTTTRAVPWSVLRDVADNVSIVRSCIEVCKAALTGLDWTFAIDSGRARALAKRSGTSSHQVIMDLQDKYADDIDRLHQWWMHPMRGVTFSEWLSAILEDELVLDAVAVYPRLSLGGDLLEAAYIDSSTIKPLLDERGSTPAPPLVAYQQILWGFPRGDYTPTSSGDVDGEYTDAVYGPIDFTGARTDALMYKVRNRRTRSPYGFSRVEQCLPDVDLWLKRWEWLRAEYTAGVTPQMIVNVDASMTPEQMREWESIVNDELSGRTGDRHRAKLFPFGFDAQFPPGFDAKFANDLDLHIVRLICADFDVLPTSLGFTPNHGAMGGQGHQQGEQDSQLQRATKPRARWVTDLINEISVNYLGMPPEVTFEFHGIDDEDEQKKATLLEGYVNNGLMTLNEGRDHLNLPRFSVRQANEPFLTTPTGPAFFDPSVEPVGMPGNLPSAQQNAPGVKPVSGNSASGAKPPASVTPSAPRDEAVQGSSRSEQKAFFTFAKSRRDGTWRDFTFKALSPEVGETANRLAAAGDMDAVKALFAMIEDAG